MVRLPEAGRAATDLVAVVRGREWGRGRRLAVVVVVGGWVGGWGREAATSFGPSGYIMGRGTGLEAGGYRGGKPVLPQRTHRDLTPGGRGGGRT